jgi:hypothetical protein
LLLFCAALKPHTPKLEAFKQKHQLFDEKERRRRRRKKKRE